MAGIDTHDVDSLAGATYFVVGRGTEGGPSSYHLSITGVTSGTSDPNISTFEILPSTVPPECRAFSVIGPLVQFMRAA